MSDYEPETADYDGVKLDNETYDELVEAANEDRSRQINESADKIVLKTKVKRGTGTRDEDKLDVKVKGDDPAMTVEKLSHVLDELEAQGVAEKLRGAQPGDCDE